MSLDSRPPRRRRYRLAVGLLLALLLIGAGFAYAKAMRLKTHVTVALVLLSRLEALATEGAGLADWDAARVAGLREDLGQLEASLRGIESELALLLPLCPHLAWVPRIGPDIAAAPALLEMAIELTSAGWWASLGGGPFLDLLRQETEPDEMLEQAVTQLAASCPYFQEARQALERAATARARFEAEALMPRLVQLIKRLDRYLPLARVGMAGLVLAPDLLGADWPRTYLLVAQNNHELRPTGGFISAVGTLRLERGRILGLELVDSYAVDDFSKAHPLPPEPLARYMWAGVLLLRDANWSPDFPASASVIASLYQLDRGGEAIDGVIAADLEVVRLLMDALGPLELPGYEERITDANVLDLLQQYWAAPLGEDTIAKQRSSEWWWHRKDIMADLLSSILDKVTADPGALDVSRLAQAAMTVLEERHLLLYLRDEDAARLLAEQGWDGALLPADGDYLMVVDANLGYNKVDPNIVRRITYQVRLDRNPPQGEVRLTYINQSRDRGKPCRREDLLELHEYQAQDYAGLMEGCYWDYVRVYVPSGSRLREASGSDDGVDVNRELGKAVFGTFFGVAPGEARELRFVYDLPGYLLESLPTEGYRLTVQKQPGTSGAVLQVDIALAEDAVIAFASSGVGVAAEGRLAYRAAMDRDQHLRIELATTGAAKPYLASRLAVAGLVLLVVGMCLRLTGMRGR